MNEKRERYAKVFCGDLWQAQIIQSLLEANHIECILRNELQAPFSSTREREGKVWVLVSNYDEIIAIAVIKESSRPSNPYN
ncbi:MAG: DUF2007 domain-containing protein [Bacteroidaceae bacterium]|nr:DUF2007 domain-containing protein [Bacteroidaceae bacterium]